MTSSSTILRSPSERLHTPLELTTPQPNEFTMLIKSKIPELFLSKRKKYRQFASLTLTSEKLQQRRQTADLTPKKVMPERILRHAIQMSIQMKVSDPHHKSKL